MFFANFRYEILPKKLKERINDLHFLDREIFELNKNNKKVNLLIINYTILSFEIFFEFKNKVSPKIRQYIEEALGEPEHNNKHISSTWSNDWGDRKVGKENEEISGVQEISW